MKKEISIIISLILILFFYEPLLFCMIGQKVGQQVRQAGGQPWLRAGGQALQRSGVQQQPSSSVVTRPRTGAAEIRKEPSAKTGEFTTEEKKAPLVELPTQKKVQQLPVQIKAKTQKLPKELQKAKKFFDLTKMASGKALGFVSNEAAEEIKKNNSEYETFFMADQISEIRNPADALLFTSEENSGLGGYLIEFNTDERFPPIYQIIGSQEAESNLFRSLIPKKVTISTLYPNNAEQLFEPLLEQSSFKQEERELELERQAEEENRVELERLAEKKRQDEIKRQEEEEQQAELERQELERQAELKRKKELRIQKAIKKIAEQKALTEQSQARELQARQEFERAQQKELQARQLLEQTEKDLASKEIEMQKSGETVVALTEVAENLVTKVNEAQAKVDDLVTKEKELQKQIVETIKKIEDAQRAQAKEEEAQARSRLEQLRAQEAEIKQELLKRQREEVSATESLKKTEELLEHRNQDLISKEADAQKSEQLVKDLQERETELVQQAEIARQKERDLIERKEESQKRAEEASRKLNEARLEEATQKELQVRLLLEQSQKREAEARQEFERVQQRELQAQELREQAEKDLASKQVDAQKNGEAVAALEKDVEALTTKVNQAEAKVADSVAAEKEIQDRIGEISKKIEDAQGAEVSGQEAQARSILEELKVQEAERKQELLKYQQEEELAKRSLEETEKLLEQRKEDWVAKETDVQKSEQVVNNLREREERLANEAEATRQKERELAKRQEELQRQMEEANKELATRKLQGVEKVPSYTTEQLERMRTDFEKKQEEARLIEERLIPEEEIPRREEEPSEKQEKIEESGGDAQAGGNREQVESEEQVIASPIEPTLSKPQQKEKIIPKIPPLLRPQEEKAGISSGWQQSSLPTQQVLPFSGNITTPSRQTTSTATSSLSRNIRPQFPGYTQPYRSFSGSDFGVQVNIEPGRKRSFDDATSERTSSGYFPGFQDSYNEPYSHGREQLHISGGRVEPTVPMEHGFSGQVTEKAQTGEIKRSEEFEEFSEEPVTSKQQKSVTTWEPLPKKIWPEKEVEVKEKIKEKEVGWLQKVWDFIQNIIERFMQAFENVKEARSLANEAGGVYTE